MRVAVALMAVVPMDAADTSFYDSKILVTLKLRKYELL